VQEILENLATQINKTSVSADDVSTSFKKLLVATQQLQDSVSQFKVN
jgi:hypothetical protein